MSLCYACWNPNCAAYAAANVTFRAREAVTDPTTGALRCPDCRGPLVPTSESPRRPRMLVAFLLGALLGALLLDTIEGAVVMGAGVAFFDALFDS